MIYRFSAAVSAPAGKLSREEKGEIRDYIESQRLEAAGVEKALRGLTRKIQGKLVKWDESGKAEIALPDYGAACKVKVTANEEA